MNKLELLGRRLKRRFLGVNYCTIENRSTHDLTLTDKIGMCYAFECKKCGLKVTFDSFTGLRG